MVHAATMACVQKAESLIAQGSADSMRYATLQLRMGIEYLFYELIPLYREELPDDICTSKWRPQEIIDSLLECNPDVDKDARIAIGDSDAEGNLSSPAIVREVKSPNKRLLRQHYHRLGSYLHAPVNLVQPEIAKWKSELDKALGCLKEYKNDQMLANIGPKVKIPCECGRVIKRNLHGVNVTGEMKCPNPQCRAVFDVRVENNQTHFTMRQTTYECPFCHTDNFVPTGRICDGMPITCAKCEKRVVVRSRFALELLDAQSHSEGHG